MPKLSPNEWRGKQEPLSSLCRRAVEAGIDVAALRRDVAKDCRRPDGTVNSKAASAKLRDMLVTKLWVTKLSFTPGIATKPNQSNHPLKVWVCGAQCTGKSKLVAHIAKTYQLPVLDEVARIEIAKMGATSFDALRTDLDAVTRFQRNVFTQQLQMGVGLDRFVSDRAFDNLAYCAESARFGTVADLWDSPECRWYVESIAQAVNSGDGVVFFVRPGVAAEQDGTRARGDLDGGGIDRIDGMIKLLLGLGRVQPVDVRGVLFQERATLVDSVLRRMRGFDGKGAQ